MGDKIFEITVNEKVFSLHYDYDSHYLHDENFDGVTFISNHRKYSSKGPLADSLSIEDITRGELKEGYEAHAITAYIHGCVTLSLSNSSYPFNDQGDSGCFGFLVFKKGEFGENNRGLESFVRSWNALLEGEVYGFTLEENTLCETCGHGERKQLDSCWGFYGYESQEELVLSMLENCLSEEEQTEFLMEYLAKI